ncbi:bi-domain-containing oxidoreductase [Halorhodospira halophila]|uniref:bi-domain-containing oxidoreductase n=1 Tax=Halorhodospira halophila TaxID=1053 RepID=UPI001F5C9000|nr:bi-domain-containing oxidoreductase [Halorhodospira halophila]
MLVEFGRAGMLNKARQQPDKVKEVLEKARTDGILTTIDAVQSKLNQPLPLGYSNVGVVSEVGGGVHSFAPGDRVLSNGPHADQVCVPQNLCARIPDAVSDEAATFTVVSAIGLQGVRLAQPTLGESFVVTGAGLIGLLTVQLLRAHGCRVLAIDFDEDKLTLARQFGAETCNPAEGEDPVAVGTRFSRDRGVDGVLITAATQSNEPVTQAARMCRKRGRIVLIGVTGLELNRTDFYEKELSFQVSCSYGPGRYDPKYEQEGHDYPFGFVRWTEQRNFEAVLDMMADGRVDPTPLITHRYAFEDASQAYETLTNDPSALGILLEYTSAFEKREAKQVSLTDTAAVQFEPQKPVVSFIGAGNYASRVLIPAFKSAGAQLNSIVTSGGTSGVIHGRRAGFANASTDVEGMLEDGETNTVAIVTPHNSHATLTQQALAAGKHVFVEKPLALAEAELDEIESCYQSAHTDGSGPLLMVGFNRRFAPHIQKMKGLLDTSREPKALVMTVNAGHIPPEHWTQDPEVGGGRIVGEACHFIDLLRHLVGAPISSTNVQAADFATKDTVTIQLTFSDGSIGTVHYFANGHKGFPKERVEAFCGGRVLQLDNFRKLKGYGWPGFRRMSTMRQDKGQGACAATFLQAVESGGPAPIPFEEVMEVSRVSVQAAEAARLQGGSA